jgi:GNAT superfamily N-acetyltransferase
MSTVTLRPATLEDDEQVLAIYNRLRFDAPPTTPEAYRHWIGSRPATAGLELWVAEADGRIVGELVAWEYWDLTEPGIWGALVDVADEFRGQGIGSRLYDHLLRRASDRKMRRLLGEVREDRPDGMAFVTARGFRPTGRVERHSRLAVGEARLEGLEAVEEKLRHQGIRVTTLAEIGPDDEAFLRALHAMHEAAMMDVPMSVLFEPRPFEEWLHHTLRYTGYSPETTWIALHGDQPVGVARVRREADVWLNNSFTGVDRAYRGRGIASALKLRSIRWARDNGIAYIYTGNDEENRSMLAVNRRLGYEALPASIELAKDLVNPPL